jgi:predicted AlkP superfamily phosphohydrolase/phosphomutase
LLGYRHPQTGEPVVAAVHRREDIYRGPYAAGGPDLLVETARTVCMVEGLGRRPIMAAGRGPEERTGNHARDGILVMHGPEVRANVVLPTVAIEDVTPTVLHLLGLAVDADMDGRVLTEALHSASVAAHPVVTRDDPYPMVPRDVTFTSDDEAKIQDMLEGLGYV